MTLFRTVTLMWSSGVLLVHLNNSLLSIWISRKRHRQIWGTGEEDETGEDRLKVGGNGGRERESKKGRGRERKGRNGEREVKKGARVVEEWEREMGKEEW